MTPRSRCQHSTGSHCGANKNKNHGSAMPIFRIPKIPGGRSGRTRHGARVFHHDRGARARQRVGVVVLLAPARIVLRIIVLGGILGPLSSCRSPQAAL